MPVHLLIALVMFLVAAPSSGGAQGTSDQVPTLGTSASGLPGLVSTGRARTEPGVVVAATAGYGYIESVGAVDGSQHRSVATLGVAVAPTPFMVAALRLDGRLDFHPDDGMGSHVTAVGDPRLLVRAGGSPMPGLELGAELGVWLPGESAPSFVLSATSLEGRALGAYDFGGWTLLAAPGFRWDNSAQSAPDAAGLRPGDRVVLGLSDASAVLLSLGLLRRVSRDAQLFVELSADMLVGSDGPGVLESPLRATVGGRHRLGRALSGEATMTVNVGARPDVGPADPFAPIEPRLLLAVGLRYGHVFNDKASVERVPVAEPIAEPPPRVLALVTGRLLDDGQEPLPDALVVLRTPDGREREAITDAEGRYQFSNVPIGPAELTFSAAGFEDLTVTSELASGMAKLPERALDPRPEAGVVRGLARSFESEPLPANIDVLDGSGTRIVRVKADMQGRFELTLPPGKYTISIQHSEYRSQRRSVRVEDGGVTILNVDLKR